MKLVLAVFRKEMLDSIRDRRSLMSALLYPLFGPLLIAAMFTYIAKTQGAEQPVELAVVGPDNAPHLVEFLRAHEMKVISPPADPQAAVEAGDLDVALVIPDDHADEFRSGRPASLQLIVDESRQEAQTSIRRVRRVLEGYSRQIGTLRLLARGLDPSLMRPLEVEVVDLATAQKKAANFLNMLPMFVLLAAFIGGMYVATDTTAGERERGSLEPLLINPVDRRALVTGKWLATVSFGAVAVALTLLFSLLALSQVPLEEIGIRLDIGVSEVLGILAATLPLALLAGGIQMLVATFARSFKEAQSYLSLLLFIPMLPAIFLGLHPLDSELWMMFVPILGQQVLLMDVLRAEPTFFSGFVVAGTSALVLSLGAVEATARLFSRERIVFGR